MDFRLYDNALGRFFGIDALSEQNHYLSTYNFADGNPVVFSDPSGLDSIGGYDPKDVYGNHKHMFRGNNQFVDVVALLAGNSAGGSSSNASASFADLDKKIDNFFSDKSKNAPRELTFVEIAGSWEPYDPTTILLEEVVVTGSMGNLVFPIEKMQKIIETAQQRFNARFGAVGGNGMLSEHLSLNDVIRSDTAKRNGISNMPDEIALNNLRHIGVNIYDVLYKEFNGNIKISSGYRSPTLNKKVGGSKNSQHVNGQALDIQGINGVRNSTIFNFIMNNLEYHQLIWEYGNKNDPRWIHVGLRPPGGGINSGSVFSIPSNLKKF
jgi:hypothetical protein